LSGADGRTLDTAAVIADGTAVNWADLGSELTDDERALMAQLRVVEQIARLFQEADEDEVRVDPAASATTTVDAAPRSLPSSDESAVPQSTPSRWGSLVIRERVGAGSFGEVFRAFDAQLDREVALKLLFHDSPLEKRVIEEGRVMAKVRHANVASVFGVGDHDDRVGLWMEFVKGRTLSELLREQGTMSPREATLVGLDLCRAVAAVHATGLVHGDIKGQNVMREQGGRVVLMDFGTGRPLASPDAPAAMRVSGTPLYMAPEAFAGKGSTQQSDLYSLGVLLFHLVTGQYPVAGSGLTEIVAAHQRGEVKRLRDVRPDLPSDFIQAVEGALAIDPGERYASAGEMEASLNATLGVGTGPRRDVVQPASIGARNKSRLLGRMAAVALIVAPLAYWLASRDDRPSDDPPPTSESAPATTLVASSIAVPEAVAPVAAPSLRVEASFFKSTPEGSLRLAPGSRVGLGDKLFLELKPSRDVYTYLINEDDRGAIYLLFPLPHLELQNPLSGGSTHRVPGRWQGQQLAWSVTTVGGTERFMLVTSSERLADFEAAIADLPKPQPGALAVPLTRGTVARLRGVGGLVVDDQAAARTEGVGGLLDTLKARSTQDTSRSDVRIEHFQLMNPNP